jgi:hypothetical protein
MPEPLDHHLACDVAYSVTAHAVGNGPQAVLGHFQARVFIDLANETGVGAGGGCPSKLTGVAHETSEICIGAWLCADELPW